MYNSNYLQFAQVRTIKVIRNVKLDWLGSFGNVLEE
jgi:hypothetical protein